MDAPLPSSSFQAPPHGYSATLGHGGDGGSSQDQGSKSDVSYTPTYTQGNLTSKTAKGPEPAGSKPTGTKRKREKYASKACNACKERKIKCAGGFPCTPCVQRKVTCTTIDTPPIPDQTKNALSSNTRDAPRLRNLESTQSLHVRMTALESNLTTVSEALLRIAPSNASNSLPASSPQDHDVAPSTDATEIAVNHLRNTIGTPRDFASVFSGKSPSTKRPAGETSVTHAMQSVEDRLKEIGIPIAETSPEPGTPPVTPLPSNQEPTHGISRHSVRQLLIKYAIVPDREAWDHYVEAFFAECYSLYPLLPPNLAYEVYEELWEVVSTDTNDTLVNSDRMVQGLLVVSIGRCAISSRVLLADGAHSAGWSLYCTALELQGDLLNSLGNVADPLPSLQILLLIVLALLRLDASERAQTLLSPAIIHAHHIGLHLQQTYDKMSSSEAEAFKRIWWTMYVIDRRIALLLGRPFIIQDHNISLPMENAFDMSTSSMETSGTPAADSKDSLPTEPSPLVYLNSMISYSKMVGKVWEALFGGNTSKIAKPHVHEYLDSLVYDWMDSIPKYLVCDYKDVHANTRPTQTNFFKQRFLIQLRFLHALILIRSPVRQSSASSSTIEADTICLQQARHMVNMFVQCSLKDGVYGFPYLPYLLEAAISIIACLTRIPSLKSKYRETTETAFRILKLCYTKTWVSGKIARMIFRLGEIIPRVFSSESETSVKHLERRVPEDIKVQTEQPAKSSMTFTSPLNTIPVPQSQSKLQQQTQPQAQTQIPLPPSSNSPHYHRLPPNYQFLQASSVLPTQAQSQLPSSTAYDTGLGDTVPYTTIAEASDANIQEPMLADFPFEMGFRPYTSAAGIESAMTTYHQGAHAQGQGNGQARESELAGVFSMPFFGAYDLGWSG